MTQAAFADAYRAVLRGARPQSPRAWLLAISENVRRRRFRTAQRRPREELVDDADFPLAAELPYEQSRALTEALATPAAGAAARLRAPRDRRALVRRDRRASSTRPSARCRCCSSERAGRCASVLDPPTVAVRTAGLPAAAAGLGRRALVAGRARDASRRAPPAPLGAAVLTVGGASVAVPVSQADGIRPAPAAATRPPLPPRSLPPPSAPRQAHGSRGEAARGLRQRRPREADCRGRRAAVAAGSRRGQPPTLAPVAGAAAPSRLPTPAAGTPQRGPGAAAAVRCRLPPVLPLPLRCRVSASGAARRSAAAPASRLRPAARAGRAAGPARGRRDRDRRGGRRWGERSADAGSLLPLPTLPQAP